MPDTRQAQNMLITAISSTIQLTCKSLRTKCQLVRLIMFSLLTNYYSEIELTFRGISDKNQSLLISLIFHLQIQRYRH